MTKNRSQKPIPPPPPPPILFTIVTYIWVEKRPNGARGPAKEVLVKSTRRFSGTLAGAEATLAKNAFYTAKIFEGSSLVATVRGTQPNPNCPPVS